MQSSTRHKTQCATAGRAGATAGLSSSAQAAGATAGRSSSAQVHRGFTLVELLTVIVIIGILAGLITAAAVPAIRRAREYTIRQEIAQLSFALEEYRNQRGDYPPDFAGVNGGAGQDTGPNSLESRTQAAVLRHFRRAFPRYQPGASPDFTDPRGTYAALLHDINYATRTEDASGNVDDYNSGLDTYNIPLTPAAALVFMLGGPPAPGGSSPRLLGFSANPANPFARGGSRLPRLYEFDETRLQLTYQGGMPTSWPVLIPPHMPQPSSGDMAPYVYFRPRNRNYLRALSTGGPELPYYFQSQAQAEEQGICTPYADTVTLASNGDVTEITRWMEPTRFQIICAGLDGLYREPQPEGDTVVAADLLWDQVRRLNIDQANIAPEEDDNITSFTQGKLEDRPEE